MKETIKYGFILGLICFLSSSVLAVVNGITEAKIKEQKAKAEGIARQEVMAQGQNFKPHYEGDKITFYRAYDSNNKLKGFVISSKTKGYSSDIETAVGLNLNLEIVGVKILSQNETPGLGNRIAEPSFLGQFQGKNLDNLNEVQAITGATISSGAVINSIKSKISELKEQLLQEVKYAG
jgi:electron transport complex protein RnfG